MKATKVIIIGAGMAGLSAAAQLTQNGLEDVILLEARDTIGGRFLIQEYNGHKLHMGAQWVHGVCPENSMFKFAEKHKLLNIDMERDGYGDMDHESFALEHVYTTGGQIVSEKLAIEAGKIHTNICKKLQEAYPENEALNDTTIQEYFLTQASKELECLKTTFDEREFAQIETVLYGCFQNILIGYAGDCIEKSSAYYFGKADELPGGDLVLPPSILEIFKDEIKNFDAVVRLGEKVTRIEWDKDKVKVVTSKEEYVTDYCISTLPPGVMQKFHHILFHPSLPESKTEALQGINPGSVGKYFVEWESNWRPKNDHPIMIAWTKEEIASMKLPEEWTKGVFEISVEDPLGSLMLVWVVGEAARAADRLPEDRIKKDIGNLINKFLGREDVPPPHYLYRNPWTADELALGSYSAASTKMSPNSIEELSEPLPEKENPRLLFAGEATHPRFWSFMHGARESGLREANRILSFHTT